VGSASEYSSHLRETIMAINHTDPRVFRALIKQALTNLGAQVAIYDRDCRLLWANRYFLEIFDRFPGGITRICLDHFHDEENCPEYLITKTFNSGNIQQGVFKIQASDGKESYFRVFLFPMLDVDGSLSNVIEISWDITKTTAYDTLLSGQNTLLNSLANASLDAILALNHNLEIIFWNNGAEKLFGYSLEEALHKDFRLLLPQSFEAERDLKLMRQLLHAQGYVKNFETEMIGKDNRSIRVELTYTYLDPELKGQAGSYLIIRDISARKNLEYIFRHTIDKLSKLHEIANLLHRSTSEDEIYQNMLVSLTAGEGLRFNRAFLFVINFENQMLEGRLAIGPADPEEADMIWSLVPEKFHSLEEILNSYRNRDRNAHEKVMDIVKALSTPLGDNSSILIQAIRNRKSYLVQNNTAHIAFDPQISYIINNDTFAVIPIITQEKVIGIFLVDNVFNREPIYERDIDALEILATQAGLALENARLQANLSMRLKELEEAYNNLQDSHEKLLRAERLAAIGEVVAKVSHEIRNPLVNIGGFTNRLLESAKKGTDDFRFLEIISAETNRLEKILENILNYSTIFQPKKELCNFKDLINKNILMVMDDLEKQGISVYLELDEAECVIQVDPYQMTQVFLNIFRNAMQAMPKGGKLSVVTHRNNNFLVVSIQDTGIGIRKRDRSKLFQPFYTTKVRGLGLGLPIAVQILSLHGGRIEVTSRYRAGTTFSIHLPIT